MLLENSQVNNRLDNNSRGYALRKKNNVTPTTNRPTDFFTLLNRTYNSLSNAHLF